MKRTNIFVKISAAVLLLAAAACTTDNLQTDGNFISLSISSKSMETRATKEGVDELNENIINDIYYFFYEKGKTDATPVVKGRLVGLDLKSGTRKEEIPVAANAAGSLFASSFQCQVFIVANPPKSMESTLSGSPTLETLRALTLVTSLKGTQENFTMVFDAEADQNAPSGNIMTIEANMQRLASKMTFVVNTSKTCTDAGSTWTSDPDKAKITFYKAYKETNLAGDFEALKKTDDKYDEKFFDSDAIEFTTKSEQDKNTWHNVAKQPVYSYPEKWDFTGSTEPYILIELPWTKSGAASPVTYYYKIFLDAKELKMNTWCNLTINIDKLGSTTPEDPTQLFSNLTYLVLKWNDAFESEDGITADVEDTRYLMLNDNYFEIYNQNKWDIPFTSSHECEIANIHYSVMTYENATPTTNTDEKNGWEWLNARKGVGITIDGALAIFEHKLTNNLDSLRTDNGVKHGMYDVAPYTFTFDIRHKDKPDDYVETVTIVQYPAIYIEPEMNSRGDIPNPNYDPTSYLNVHSPGTSNNSPGYGGDPFTMFSGNITIGNSNGNMYVITTTTAPNLTVRDVVNGKTVEKQYMLADPRQQNHREPIATDREGTSATASQVYTSEEAVGQSIKRTLENYFPTKSDAKSVNLIAPKIRVASSWGQCLSIEWAEAETRCAAYQEDGYPAGRWRVPTAAELMYICKLSSDHVIPMLYGSKNEATTDYWCSSGYVTVYQAENTSGLLNANAPVYHPIYKPDGEEPGMAADKTQQTALKPVRCVYDEWYWENRDVSGTNSTTGGRVSNYSKRIWGDMPR